MQALLTLAAFAEAKSVLDYGCGQGKLAELVLSSHPELKWRGVDQSPMMIDKAKEKLARFWPRCSLELLASGDPATLEVPPSGSVDRFVSTYCLDLMSEADMFSVLDKAEACLHPERGLLLLAGITWGCASAAPLKRLTARAPGPCQTQDSPAPRPWQTACRSRPSS